MKFVCEKCNTKYTIADEKVRRKVLKIRCKNCSSIIVVREPGAPSTEVPAVEEPERGSQGRALERAFDGAFNKAGGRARRVSSAAQPLRMSPASALASSDLIEEEAPSEQTRLSSIPDFLQESPSSGGASSSAASDDEWYLAVDTSQFGPMGFSELCSRVRRGETGAEAYVWRDGFDDWLEINDVPELKPYVPRHPPPPPRGRSGLFPVAASLPPLAGGSPNIPPPVPPGNPYLQPMRQVPATIQQHPLPPRPASQVPTAPAHPAVSSLSSSYQQRPTMQTLPPGTAAPQPPAPEPAHDSGLLNLLPTPAAPAAMPTAGAPLEQYPAPAPAPMPPRASGGTPLLLKITAVAGVASLLCGIALVAYFIFFDRSDKQRPRVAIAPSLGDPAQVTPPTPVATPRPDSGGSFQPMEIERSPKGEKAPVAKHHVAAKVARPPAKAAAPSGPTLDEKQRALMALYGNKGDQPGGGPPSAAVTGRRPRGPVRQITPNDIQSMQRKHRGPLSACYERALKRDDSLAELKAEITVTISDEGAVKGVSISGVGNDDLASCLRKDIRTWVFDPMGEQTFKFPIIFRGS